MTVVTFKSKTEVFSFLQESRLNGLGATVISLPKEFKSGCGLAVQISNGRARFAYAIINQSNYPTFGGIYLLKRINGKGVLKKLY